MNKDLKRESSKHYKYLVKGLLGRVDVRCKGLELGLYLTQWRDNKEAVRARVGEGKSSRGEARQSSGVCVCVCVCVCVRTRKFYSSL